MPIAQVVQEWEKKTMFLSVAEAQKIAKQQNQLLEKSLKPP